VSYAKKSADEKKKLPKPPFKKSPENYCARCFVADEKWATGGSPFVPSRIPPVNQPKV
jgi:hypothetical protein